MTRRSTPVAQEEIVVDVTRLARTSENQTTRTTLVLSAAVDDNLEIAALQLGISKNEVITKALVEFLLGQGLKPDMRPRAIKVSY